VRGRPQGARGWELEPTAHDGREQGARWGEHAAAVPPVRRRARPAGAAGGFRRGRGSTGAGPRARLLGRGVEQSVGRAVGADARIRPRGGRGTARGRLAPGVARRRRERPRRWLGSPAGGRWLEGSRRRRLGSGHRARRQVGRGGAPGARVSGRGLARLGQGLQARESPVARVSRAASGAAALVARGVGGAAAGAAAQAVVGLVSDPAGAGVPGRGSGSPGGARWWGRREEKRSRRLAAGREEGEGSRRLGQAGGWGQWPAAAVEGRPKPNLIPCRIVKPNPYPKQGWE
jgi:hypothetical protein